MWLSDVLDRFELNRPKRMTAVIRGDGTWIPFKAIASKRWNKALVYHSRASPANRNKALVYHSRASLATVETNLACTNLWHRQQTQEQSIDPNDRDTKSGSPDLKAGRGCLPSSSTSSGISQLMFCLSTAPSQSHIKKKQFCTKSSRRASASVQLPPPTTSSSSTATPVATIS